ncbi:MAG: hypothetical protein Q7U07_01180 [Gammaproteobacteria bacterium]|nr:hypothetical protein [Gammaproteobacteria bacterium]
MSWLQLKFQAPSALAEELADRLTDAAFQQGGTSIHYLEKKLEL